MEQNKSSKKVFCIIIALILVCVFGVCFLYFFKAKDNKFYIDFEKYYITSEISGVITELYVQEGTSIKKGEIIAKIDSSEYEKELKTAQEKLEKLNKELKLSKDDTTKINSKILSSKNNIKKTKLELENANSDYIMYKNAYQDGSVTKNDFDKSIENLKIARKNYNLAQNDLKTSNNILETNLSIKNKKTSEIKNLTNEINKAELNLSNTNIISSFDGTIAEQKLKAGERIEAGEPIVRIISGIPYVVAEYKKTPENIKENQKVLITLKNPNAKLNGKIESIYQISTIQCIKAPCIDKNAKTGIKIIFEDDISKYNINKNTKVYVKIK